MNDKEKIGFDTVDNTPDYTKSKDENIKLDNERHGFDKDK